MQALVISLMAFAIFSLLLKMSFYRRRAVALCSLGVALCLGFSWPLAVTQSKTRIADWLSNPDLMADTAVLLCLEIALQLLFCLRQVSYRQEIGNPLRRWSFRLLRGFPGLLHLAVFFNVLVQLVFLLPGVSFPLIAWSFAAGLLLFLPTAVWGVRRLLPEEDVRIELLFLVNVLMAILGMVATVNGKTAVPGFSEVNGKALGLLCLLLLAGIFCGMGLRRLHWFWKERKQKNNV